MWHLLSIQLPTDCLNTGQTNGVGAGVGTDVGVVGSGVGTVVGVEGAGVGGVEGAAVGAKTVPPDTDT